MVYSRLPLIAVLCCSPALAQTQTPQQTIAITIGNLVIQNAQNEALITAQKAQIEQLQKQIEELRAKDKK